MRRKGRRCEGGGGGHRVNITFGQSPTIGNHNARRAAKKKGKKGGGGGGMGFSAR